MDTLAQLYSYVRELIGQLERTGQTDLADRLSTAMGGSTSGEILEGLWFGLKELREQNIGGQDVADAIRYIERTLGPPRH